MTDEASNAGGIGGRARLRWRGGLSIQSKLLIMLLSVSLVASVIVAAIGFVNGRESLHHAAVDQLITIRSMRAAEVREALDDAREAASLNSRNLSAQMLSSTVNEGYAQLQDVTVTPEQDAALEAYYSEVFIPELEERSGEDFGDTAFIQESPAGRFLQLASTVDNHDFDADYDTLLSRIDTGGGTAYDRATAQYGDYFTRLIQEEGYEDALLMNLDGDVVYTAYKGPELGTNLLTGPYRDSKLAEAYAKAISTNSVSTVVLTDFER